MRIAIVKLSALGDIVHAMVALQLIKKYNKTISNALDSILCTFVQSKCGVQILLYM